MIVKDKTIVITGVGPGLGREIAACALRDGAKVVVGARNESRLKESAAALDPSGERMERVVQECVANGVRATVDSVYRLEDFAAAFAKLETGRPQGKVVFKLET